MLVGMSRRQATGLTLVELMVVIAIAAILLGIGAPSLQTFIQNTQIRTSAEGMLAGLNLARSEALRRNTRVSLWMVTGTTADCARSNTGTSWVVSIDDPVGKCNLAASETTAPRLVQSRAGNDGSAGVNVTGTDSGNAGTSCITFNGFGTVEATCTGGGNPISRVRFVSAAAPASTRPLEIEVPLGGAIRLCDPAAAASSSLAC